MERANEFAGQAVRLGGVVCGLLGWRPGAFWAATPAEVAMALGGEGAPTAAGAADLARMRAEMGDG